MPERPHGGGRLHRRGLPRSPRQVRFQLRNRHEGRNFLSVVSSEFQYFCCLVLAHHAKIRTSELGLLFFGLHFLMDSRLQAARCH